MKKEKFLKPEEVAKYLRIPRSTIYYLAKARKIPVFKVGKHWRFEKKTIDKWWKKQMKGK